MGLMYFRLFLMRWVPAFIMMGLIFYLSSLPASRIPYYGPLDVLLKKGAHALGYGLLGLSYFYALPRSLSKVYRLMIALMMAILFALSDEYHQSFVEGRNSSLNDVAINGLGAAVSLILAGFYSPNSKSNSTF